MRFNCCFCKLNVSDRTKTICCNHCNEWIHINCNELNDIDYENLKTSDDVGIANYVLKKKFYLFVLNKLILMKITQVIPVLTNTNLLNLLSQISNLTDNDNSEGENVNKLQVPRYKLFY